MRRLTPAALVVVIVLAIAPAALAKPSPLQISPKKNVNFGSQPRGSTSSQTVTLTNKGLTPVFVAGMGVSSGRGAYRFDFTSNTCGGFLTPGASCTYGILFTPPGKGQFVGQSDISALNQTFLLLLRGRGK